MSDETDVLGVNEAFYAAFSRRDLGAVQRLWASEGALTCIHPGWDALRGRAEVLASFRAIMEGQGSPRIRCLDASAEIFGDTAIVICCESIAGEGDPPARTASGADLVATNVFVRVGGGWRMIHHHAGPLSARRPRAAPTPSPKKSDLN